MRKIAFLVLGAALARVLGRRPHLVLGAPMRGHGQALLLAWSLGGSQ